MSAIRVHHFGPDPGTVGGMASVLRIMCEHDVGADAATAHPTWTPGSSTATAFHFARAVREVLALPKSELVHVHLSERGSFVREGALLALARRRGLTTVATIHGADFHTFAKRRPRLVASVLVGADALTCLDPESLALVGRLAPRVDSELIPNPVECPASVLHIDETPELVLFAGEIGYRKGADVLCESWPKVTALRPQARCLMVGPVSDFTPPRLAGLEVRSPVDALGMAALLRQARVVALPSRADAMPMALLEAMSQARPIVSTPVGAIPELAAEAGMLVAVDDAEGLAAALAELLGDSPLARRLGERGREICLATRDTAVIDARMRGLYEAAVRRHH